ncbi:fibrous sheath-interacting protein 2-like isoform X3 [Alligator sinensis]|uniref:Fibrous sheath-interacting protein 2-like isoform X3 n=1 Tax=Alligator sinensis TaxID=38654 RepID=A0A3Q0GLT9_ALLSI|nr:fibrous sheath-interacting protein 2-like isoform X3 [Alligator sinensis]
MCARLTSEPVPARKLRAQGDAVPGSDPSRISADAVELVLTQLSTCLATDPQPSEDQGLPPDVAVLAAQIIRSGLSDLLHDGASKVTVYADPSGNESAPAEGSDVWLWSEMADDRREGAMAKAPSSALSTPREPGEFGERQLEDASKSTAQHQSPPLPTLEVGPGCLEDAIGRLLSRALPATASTSASTEKKATPADVDLTHVKVIGRVLARICRGETSSCQRVAPPPSREESASQTIADAVYGRLLTRFLSKLDTRQRVRSGSEVLGEALWDSVVREISGKPLQNSLSGELARRLVETAPRAVTEPLGDSSRRSLDLHATVALIAEKLAANLLSAFPCLIPVAALDAEKALLVNEEARKIRHALRALLSSHRRNGDKQIGARVFVRAEDGQATGDPSPSARASPADRADSDLCGCRGLTGREAVFAPRIAASGAQRVASPGARAGSEEETLPAPSCMAEGVGIEENLPADLDTMEEIPKPTFGPGRLAAPGTFAAGILSSFLPKVSCWTEGRSPKLDRGFARAEATVLGKALRRAVEQGPSVCRLGHGAAAGEPRGGRPEAVDRPVLSVSGSVLREAGPEGGLCDDVSGGSALFPRQAATAVVEELSDGPCLRAVGDCPPAPSRHPTSPGRLAGEALSQASVGAEPWTGSSAEGIPAKTGELPVKRIPRVTIRQVPIASESGTDYLRVIYVRAEPLEELREAVVAPTGDDPRTPRALLAATCPDDGSTRSEARGKADRHFSAVSLGQPTAPRPRVGDIEPSFLTQAWQALPPRMRTEKRRQELAALFRLSRCLKDPERKICADQRTWGLTQLVPARRKNGRLC